MMLFLLCVFVNLRKFVEKKIIFLALLNEIHVCHSEDFVFERCKFILRFFFFFDRLAAAAAAIRTSLSCRFSS